MRTFIHACRFLLGLDAPESQVTSRELDRLINYAQDARVIVELGCFEGRTAVALAKGTQGTVYSIDPFPPGKLGFCHGELIARLHSKRNGLTNVKIIKGFSHDVAATFRKTIDLLFIDADHAYEAVHRDWQDWIPKVNEGGIIALHDSRVATNSPDYLGSMKFYDEFVPTSPEVKEVAVVDSLAILVKARVSVSDSQLNAAKREGVVPARQINQGIAHC